jgi:hypothetical protein
MIAFSFVITLLVVTLIVSFVLYIVAVFRLPSDRRPRPPVYNRFGERIGWAENPDYRVNPGQEEHGGPKILRHPPPGA